MENEIELTAEMYNECIREKNSLKNDLETMLNKYDELGEQFVKTVDALKTFTNNKTGVMFFFEDGFGVFIPLFENIDKTLSKFDKKPIKMSTNFSPDMISHWIKKCSEYIEQKE